jgi:hypothetical protein
MSFRMSAEENWEKNKNTKTGTRVLPVYVFSMSDSENGDATLFDGSLPYAASKVLSLPLSLSIPSSLASSLPFSFPCSLPPLFPLPFTAFTVKQ